MKIEFSRQIFENAHIKFRENPSSGRRVVPFGRTGGQTDRHDEANSRFFANFRTGLRIKDGDTSQACRMNLKHEK